MSNVVNRTTLKYLKSVHTPDFPDPPWVRDPDVSALDGTVDNKYWKMNGNLVVEMSQAEKDVVDANELLAAKTKRKDDVTTDTAYQRQIAAVAALSSAEITTSDTSEKALVDALPRPSDADAYTDSRLPPPRSGT